MEEKRIKKELEILKQKNIKFTYIKNELHKYGLFIFNTNYGNLYIKIVEGYPFKPFKLYFINYDKLYMKQIEKLCNKKIYNDMYINIKEKLKIKELYFKVYYHNLFDLSKNYTKIHEFERLFTDKWSPAYKLDIFIEDINKLNENYDIKLL